MSKGTSFSRIFPIVVLLIAGVISPFTFATTDNLNKPTGSIIQIQEAHAAVHVKGYRKKNGTYVQPHYRSNPDGNPYNNWSYPGNTNPYTGKVAPGNPDTYLNNYYNNSSGYTPTYVAPIIYNPTCPSNSYYNSLDNSCKCNPGYAIFDNGTACVSGYSYCTNKYGIHANYSSLNLRCECSYGYSIVGGQCISDDEQCQTQLGSHSSYNSLNDNCKCDYGYYIVNGQCIEADSSCQAQFGSNSEAGDPGKCQCKTGFQWDSTGTSCVRKDAPPITNTNLCGLNSISTTEGKCRCKTGYKWVSSDPNDLNCTKIENGATSTSPTFTSKLTGSSDGCSSTWFWKSLTSGVCISREQWCKEQSSKFTYWSGNECGCISGYKFSDRTKTKCIKQNTIE